MKPDQEVRPLKIVKSCAPVLLSLGTGELTVTDAIKDAGITKIRQVEIHDNYLLIAKQKCVVAKGE